MARPNLVLIMTDQQRKDTLGCYGSETVPTPFLDGLAEEGTAFDRFYANNPVCVPSRCSFLTGRYPAAHRCRDLNRPLDPGEPHLFARLKQAGYRLGLSGKNHALPSSELHRLFDDICECGHGKAQAVASEGVYGSAVDPTPLNEYPTVRLGRHAQNFIRDSAKMEQPFALWLSFPDPHTPVQAPEPYASMADGRMLPPRVEPKLNANKPASQRLLEELQGLADADEAELARFRAIYYGMVALIDREVGGVLRELERAGLDERTIVVFTSDHGEYLGDHGMVRKSWNFYDCLLNVPLLIRWKGVLPSARRTEALCEAVDVLPTLLELMGLTVPEGVQGTSLVPLLRGEETLHKSYIFAEAGNPNERAAVRSTEEWRRRSQGQPFWTISASQGCMVRTHEWKLCRYINGEGELYDLLRDPGETNNLYESAGYAATRAKMLELLTHALMATQDPRLSASAPFGEEGREATS